MELRAHHLLCIQNYRGEGYDEAFTAHMTQVVQRLEGDPVITLVEGCDELCIACPHNDQNTCDPKTTADWNNCGICSPEPTTDRNNCGICDVETTAGGTCDAEAKVARYDRRVLEACGFHVGMTGKWSALAAEARKTILGTDRFRRICGGCQWHGLCREMLRKNEIQHEMLRRREAIEP